MYIIMHFYFIVYSLIYIEGRTEVILLKIIIKITCRLMLLEKLKRFIPLSGNGHLLYGIVKINNLLRLNIYFCIFIR